jgi:hypothetical protein
MPAKLRDGGELLPRIGYESLGAFDPNRMYFVQYRASGYGAEALFGESS